MGTTAQKLQAIVDGKADIRAAINEKGVDVDESVVFSEYGNKIREISGGGGIPAVDPPSGDFYAAIAYFKGENGDYDNIAYAFANNSTEFTAQFCHSSAFVNFTLHGTAGGSDSVIILHGKMAGFFFGSQFNLTALPNYFLANCQSFNAPLVLSNNLTSIGEAALQYCYSFNQPLTLPSGLTSIGNSFLYNCYSFNHHLTLPESLTSINSGFLDNCYSFNQPLTLPNNLTSIGINFLRNCYSFNQPLVLSESLMSIGISFLYNCHLFNHHLTLPESLTSINSNFLYNCYSLDHLVANCATSPSDNNSLAINIADLDAYVNGIVVSGAYAQTWINNLPNRTSSPYRKLILAP